MNRMKGFHSALKDHVDMQRTLQLLLLPHMSLLEDQALQVEALTSPKFWKSTLLTSLKPTLNHKTNLPWRPYANPRAASSTKTDTLHHTKSENPTIAKARKTSMKTSGFLVEDTAVLQASSRIITRKMWWEGPKKRLLRRLRRLRGKQGWRCWRRREGSGIGRRLNGAGHRNRASIFEWYSILFIKQLYSHHGNLTLLTLMPFNRSISPFPLTNILEG